MSPIEIADTAKQSSPQHWHFSEEHIDSRYAQGVSNAVLLRLHNKIMQATSRSLPNS
jgi:hypothetical protein